MRSLRTGMTRVGLRVLLAASGLRLVESGRRASRVEPWIKRGRKGAQGWVELVEPRRFYKKLAEHPKMAFGETYADGLWRVVGADLADTLIPAARRLGPLFLRVGILRSLLGRSRPDEERNTVLTTRREIAAHYDLSNDLFTSFLDPSITYSSALFDPSARMASQTLEEAQLRKIDAVLDLAGVGQGTRLLEIGSGWGTLAIRAAQRGATVSTYTLSSEQAELARSRALEAGMGDRVEVVLKDYRQVEGRFDAAVSVEMIEAVGGEFLPDYFKAVSQALVPGGTFALQAIFVGHRRFLISAADYGWIEKYIFPGGQIPSVEAMHTAATGAGWSFSQERTFGLSYAETLRRWRHAFCERTDEVTALGFDQRFVRLWELYLAYSEAGFASGALDVGQFRLVKVGQS